MSIRTAMAAGALALLGVGAASPVLAQDGEEAAPNDEATDEPIEFLTEEDEARAQVEQELRDAFGLFGLVYETVPLTPEQEAALPLAEQMAAQILPEGAMAKATEQTVRPMMAMIAQEVSGNPRARLAELTGVSIEDLDTLEDSAAEDALALFDPGFAERGNAIGEWTADFTTRLAERIEPTYRKALARALAIRFDAAEMAELIAFFETPLGAKFASASFLVHHDPAALAAMEEVGPLLIEMLPTLIDDIAALEKLGSGAGSVRGFSDLSASERTRAAALIGKSPSELDALEPPIEVEATEAEDDEPVV